jgi:hypothetical protein
MPSHFSMGALNKCTNEYEYPAIASKSNSYKCPSCNKDVIFKKGEIKRPHFSHKKSDSPCHYYDRPNETQIHKDAKNLLYTLLKNKTEFNIKRTCVKCNGIYHVDGEFKGHTISHLNYEDGLPIPIIEYSFKYHESNKKADVALVYDSDSHCETHIFEICHTNATKECDRPEPWFEFDALTLINDINNQIQYRFSIDLHCLRQPDNNNKCSACIKQHIKFEQEQHMKQLRKCQEEEIKKEKDRLYQIERKKERDEHTRLYKLRQAEEQRKKLEQQEQAIKKLEEQQKQREAAYEAEKLKREQIIERIRQKHPNILKPVLI